MSVVIWSSLEEVARLIAGKGATGKWQSEGRRPAAQVRETRTLHGDVRLDMSPESVQRFRDKDMRKISKPTARRVNPYSRDVL
jgi:hypothetical protein